MSDKLMMVLAFSLTSCIFLMYETFVHVDLQHGDKNEITLTEISNKRYTYKNLKIKIYKKKITLNLPIQPCSYIADCSKGKVSYLFSMKQCCVIPKN